AKSGTRPKRFLRKTNPREPRLKQQAIPQGGRAEKEREGYSTKADGLPKAKKFMAEVLLTTGLAPAWGGWLYRIQAAGDYLKGGAAWLSGQQPPRHEDNEQTLGEARARIRKTIEFVESVKADRYADAASQIVKVSWVPGKLTGENYLLQIVI